MRGVTGSGRASTATFRPRSGPAGVNIFSILHLGHRAGRVSSPAFVQPLSPQKALQAWAPTGGSRTRQRGKRKVGVKMNSEDDPELAAIRQRRMQQLMAQHDLGNQQNPDQQKAQEDAKREADERRQLMLSQILSSQARERLARIALVKPEKARGVEDVLLRAAQMGQIAEKVSEERLISLLEQINNQTTRQTKVTIQRRRNVLEDDD
ncbi:uncharacterized protein LOC116254809 [Nymphaea colorata]|nr:uncharacterized protein LOC116254809 [Nymphaea colorata]